MNNKIGTNWLEQYAMPSETNQILKAILNENRKQTQLLEAIFERVRVEILASSDGYE
jgi:hypothetical protein